MVNTIVISQRSQEAIAKARLSDANGTFVFLCSRKTNDCHIEPFRRVPLPGHSECWSRLCHRLPFHYCPSSGRLFLFPYVFNCNKYIHFNLFLYFTMYWPYQVMQCLSVGTAHAKFSIQSTLVINFLIER